MIPNAKKNLHQCAYHLQHMKIAKNAEEFEIAYAAFVMSSRTVTFVLQKEYKGKNLKFDEWYQKKANELDVNKIAKFFKNERNSIEKEGINALHFSFRTKRLRLNAGGRKIQITGKGPYQLINEGEQTEDLVPLDVKTEDIEAQTAILVSVAIEGTSHNVFDICNIHYLILKKIVEEWTGIINEKTEANSAII